MPIVSISFFFFFLKFSFDWAIIVQSLVFSLLVLCNSVIYLHGFEGMFPNETTLRCEVGYVPECGKYKTVFTGTSAIKRIS